MAARDRRAGRLPDVPVSAFADIAFLLIIFFIVAATLGQITGMVAEIPAGEKKESKADKATSVQLYRNKILLNEQGVSITQLRKSLAELNLHAKAGEDKVVLLEAIGNVEYQTYFDVMASISAAGGVTAILREETQDK